ncbi:hypothetical protein WJX79_004975 [Trebouxia sp. C0005]
MYCPGQQVHPVFLGATVGHYPILLHCGACNYQGMTAVRQARGWAHAIGYPIPKTVQPERAVEGTNREIDHGADLTKETGKAFTEGKVHGEAQGEKHLDNDLDKLSAPSGAAKLKEDVLKANPNAASNRA